MALQPCYFRIAVLLLLAQAITAVTLEVLQDVGSLRAGGHKGTGKSDMEGRNAVHVGDLLYCAWPEVQAVYSDGLEGVVEAQGLHAFFCKAWRARSARIPVLYSSPLKAESSMQS